MEKASKRKRRDRKRCVHYFDYNECGITSGGIHWHFECRGPCECYKERKQKKEEDNHD